MVIDVEYLNKEGLSIDLLNVYVPLLDPEILPF